MSADGDTAAPHEIVIVRRRGGDGDDGHHGGAWKIAFADLMTAMMAFFLVMWLLNVSDKEKIQQIATYFNPLKLNSKQPSKKGVEEENDEPTSVSQSDVKGKKSAAAAKRGGDGELKEGVEHQAEEELFNDPYGVLARLAAKAEDGKAGQSEAQAQGNPQSSSEAITNPFDPFADQSFAPPKSEQSEHEQLTLDEPGTHPQPPGLEKPLEVQPEETAKAPAAAAAAKEPAAPVAAAEAPAAAPAAVDEVSEIDKEIAKSLAAISPDRKPNIEVKKVADGVLISLTDDFKFGMFGSASAEPRPELVVVMEKVAKVLVDHDGKIVVRGHTDARPFRTERNNNWRLSMSRAQMAYYMLVRGGVDERRFDSIEGRSDRFLKVPTDPNAAENRRIEILLRPKA